MLQVWMKFMRLRGECFPTWVPMSRDEPQQGCYRTLLISRKARPRVLQTTSTSRVQYHQQSGLKFCNVCFLLLIAEATGVSAQFGSSHHTQATKSGLSRS